jgi:hypothetical protein
MTPLELSTLIAQVQSAQPANPLIDRSGQHLIYIGVGSIAILLTIIVGLFSRRVAEAVIFSLVLAGVLILLLWLA